MWHLWVAHLAVGGQWRVLACRIVVVCPCTGSWGRCTCMHDSSSDIYELKELIDGEASARDGHHKSVRDLLADEVKARGAHKAEVHIVQ